MVFTIKSTQDKQLEHKSNLCFEPWSYTGCGLRHNKNTFHHHQHKQGFGYPSFMER